LPVEKEYSERLIKMLDAGLVKYNQKELRKDSDIFFEQYTQRRGKSFNFATLIGKV
jgi:hypothetical protein